MDKLKLYIIVLFAVLFISYGCDGPKLERPIAAAPPLPKVSMSGNFMTESPDKIQFPVKVLFAIDYSLSMGTSVGAGGAVPDPNDPCLGSDPYNKRRDAARDFIDKYYKNENVSFEIMIWNSKVVETTKLLDGKNGFTRDREELNRVLDFNEVDATTNVLGTLDTIYTDIERDIKRSRDGSLVRTKYVVVFLSDGMAQVQVGRNLVDQDSNKILNKVSEITEMVKGNGAAGINFHTLLLYEADCSNDTEMDKARNLLFDMSRRGMGDFVEFQGADAINFIKLVDMRLTVEYKIKTIFAYNLNVVAGADRLYPDSDGDGLTDKDEEEIYGTDPCLADTDDDGLSDFFEIKVSSPGFELDPHEPDSQCTPMYNGEYSDRDNDLFNDCEELFKGTDKLADTDRDGFPDGIEFRSGSNPLSGDQSADSDFDGVPDWKEIQLHSNLNVDDPGIRERHGYRYNIEDSGLIQIDQGTEMESYVREYKFNITNIDVIDTKACENSIGPDWKAGDNIIYLFIGQTPENKPNDPPIFRVLQTKVNFYSETDRAISIVPADFSLIQ